MSACVVPLTDRVAVLTPKVRELSGAKAKENKQPPPLPSTSGSRADSRTSMRVPKGSTASSDQAVDDGWDRKIAQTRARLAAEEHERQAALLKAASLSSSGVDASSSTATDEAEWGRLRAQAAARQRAAEEREWAERVARARASEHAFSTTSAVWPAVRAFSAPVAARVIAWP